MLLKIGLCVVFILSFAWVSFPKQAHATGAFELSTGASYSRSNYSPDSFNWTRRLGFSLGYYFSERTEVEFTIQDIIDRTVIAGYEDTNFHDQIYSANWVQSLLGKDHFFQPYFKIGIGQLNRDATGTYSNGASPPLHVDAITGVLGVGLRLYITRTFAIRSEATSYLAGGSVRNWKNNISVTFGISLYF